jgi:hypothetical protein
VRSVAPALVVIFGLTLARGALALEPYRFPLSVDPSILAWEEPHWDGSNAVDIGIHSGYAIGASERVAFYAAEALAVTSGVASRLDNPRGGIAVVLHGDDGRSYYYAHLSQTQIVEPTRVEAGASLGRIGRTGTWTQYLEPHLHFSIAEGHQSGTDWIADVPAAAWLRRTFGVMPVRRTTDAYVADYPEGLPLFGDPRITVTFERSFRDNPLLAGLTVEPRGLDHRDGGDRPDQTAARSAVIPIRAPMTGIARVHLDTLLGVRLQITNSRSARSLIVSGAIEPGVRTGDLVYADSIVGFARGSVHYMVFAAGRPVDPLGR